MERIREKENARNLLYSIQLKKKNVLIILCLMCCQFVAAHLSFLQFILQEGGLYLPWHRARDIWDTLVASAQASDWDTDVS